MKRATIALTMFVLVAPVAALPEPTPDELLANRRRFEQLRRQPDAVQKLRAEAEAFFGLEKEHRRQIARIEKALRQEPPATQTRLVAVLDRYVDWLHHRLDDATRRKLLDTADPQQRLRLIRELREEQWIAEQPQALRERLAKVQGDERRQLIAKERADEHRRRVEWTVAKNFWPELEGDAKGRKALPVKFADFPTPVQNYVRDYLQRMFLSPEEVEQLGKLEGQWPQYPMKLVELADRHPAALPGPRGPKSVAELPPRLYSELKQKLPNPKRLDKLPAAAQPAQLAAYFKIKEGQWPEFGAELARVAQQHGLKFEHEFVAYKLDCLAPPMQEFVNKQLKPALDGKESLQLAEAIGKWPDYPRTIQDLASKHQLRPPWFTLPPGDRWEGYRIAR